jgi:2-polyprenyl-3-methyl-5-hydroxy-6-metoxy-1,4-benzoquinol methylase
MPSGTAKSILDIGCGDGLFFDRLQRFGEVEGIESSQDHLDPSGPHRSKITVAPFDAGFKSTKQYDLILMLDVLEHLSLPEEAIRHSLSLLKRNGLLLVTVPAFRLLWTKHDDLNQHRTRFTKTSFRRLAGCAGLEIVAMRYFFAWLFPAKVLARIFEAVVNSKAETPKIPGDGVNDFLYRLSRAENEFSRHLNIPFGSSLLVVGRPHSAKRQD